MNNIRMYRDSRDRLCSFFKENIEKLGTKENLGKWVDDPTPGFFVKILADSQCIQTGARLVTMQWTFPRCILAEINTHRMMSKNAASSRAIPVKTMIRNILKNPFIPVFAKNQKGMQSAEVLNGFDKWVAEKVWLLGMRIAILLAKILNRLNIHKQFINRMLEPWMWTTIVISGTDWENLFALRYHPMAEPSFQKIARLAYHAMECSIPEEMHVGDWHLPYIFEEDVKNVWELAYEQYGKKSPLELNGGIEDQATSKAQLQWASNITIFINETLRKISVGRCARVSYLTQDGKRDIQEDIKLHDRLIGQVPGHWSPFEHVAMAAGKDDVRSGNFYGWAQYRKMFNWENIESFQIPEEMK